MRQYNIQARLSMLGAASLSRVYEAEPAGRRQILVDEGASPEVVSKFNDLLLNEQEVVLFEAIRVARDIKGRGGSRFVDPLLDAELSRRRNYTSPFSGQDIAERSG